MVHLLLTAVFLWVFLSPDGDAEVPTPSLGVFPLIGLVYLCVSVSCSIVTRPADRAYKVSKVAFWRKYCGPLRGCLLNLGMSARS